MARHDPADVELTWPGKERAPRAADVSAADLVLLERSVPQSAQVELPLDVDRNLLVRGDNLLAMECLRARFAGKIALVYIDPPYATGLSYYSQAEVAGEAVERRAYRDDLAGGIAQYVDAMHRRLRVVHDLLSPDGKLFVHCDWRASAYLRLVLDEIFGPECFRNEIIWRRAPNLGRQAASKQLGRVFDSILVFSKSEGAPFPGPVPRRRNAVELDGKGKPKGARWDEEARLYFTTAPRGDYTDDSIAELRKKNRVYDSPSGKVYIKYFLTQGDDGRWYKEQPVDSLWDDFEVRPLRHRPKSEVMGYDTQKPEGLLERIVSWATRPGDWVADFYAGSGTTPAVAARLGRRFVACDREHTAIDICRRRLAAHGATFDLCSVERAERRVAAPDVLCEAGAELIEPGWGRREQMLWHVGPLTEPMGAEAILAACGRARGLDAIELTVAAWEWEAHDCRALRARALAEHGVTLTMRTIPHEVARGRGRATFRERSEVEVELVNEGASWAVCLLGVRCPEPPPLRGGRSPDAILSAWRIERGGATLWHAERAGDRLENMTPFFPREEPRTVTVRAFTVFGEEIAQTIPC